MPPLVSVVVPTYNRAYCVADTVRSVIAQTYPHWELLLIDDGSTDATKEKIQSAFASEARVRYVHQCNQGVSSARNHGLRLAQGDFVALLDSDDLWQPWKLELQIACMERLPELVMTWTDMTAIDPHGKIVADRYLRTMYHAYAWFEDRPLFSGTRPLREVVPTLASTVGDALLHTGAIYGPMLMGNLVHTSTTMFRRPLLERIGKFDEHFRSGGEDYDFHLRTCREGPVGLLDLSTIQYQVGLKDRFTRASNNIHFARGYLRTLTTALARDRDRITLPKTMIQQALAAGHGWIGEEALRQGDRGEARTHLWKSLTYGPGAVRTYALLAAAMLPAPLANAGIRLYRFLRGSPTIGTAQKAAGHDATTA